MSEFDTCTRHSRCSLVENKFLEFLCVRVSKLCEKLEVERETWRKEEEKGISLYVDAICRFSGV